MLLFSSGCCFILLAAIFDQLHTQELVRVGVVLPKLASAEGFFGKGVHRIFAGFNAKGSNRYKRLKFEPVVSYLNAPTSPAKILDVVCDSIVARKVAAVIYVNAWNRYASRTASNIYFLQLASATKIPILAWNADNSALFPALDPPYNERNILQLAPPIEHQIQAVLALMERYGWHHLAVLISNILGHEYFIERLKHAVSKLHYRAGNRVHILATETLHFPLESVNKTATKLQQLLAGDARIILLHCTQPEAQEIFAVLKGLPYAQSEYTWIITQAAVADLEVHEEIYPVGLLGIHFNAQGNPLIEVNDAILPQIRNAMRVLNETLHRMLEGNRLSEITLESNSSCARPSNFAWHDGSTIYKHLLLSNVQAVEDIQSISDSPEIISFDGDGQRRMSKLTILNMNKEKQWTVVGEFYNGTLHTREFVWSDGQRSPPSGIPQKHNLSIVTLDEAPFVITSDLLVASGDCPVRSVRCQWGMASDGSSLYKCCSGFSIDLLVMLAADVGFNFTLYRVHDMQWGMKDANLQWNGLVRDLIVGNADMCATSLKINSERVRAIDFSYPWLESGIAVLVRIRRGGISTGAFLEPFEWKVWIIILLGGVHLVTFSIFFFEWLSPQSYNRKRRPPIGHRFSLVRVYWLVWATLFSASVGTDVPRSHTARFTVLVWAAFAMIFYAVYTANLAAFMITQEEHLQLDGLDDPKVAMPFTRSPPLSVGVVRNTNTHLTVKGNRKQLSDHIERNKYYKANVVDGVTSVKNGTLDAFLYDAVALEYLADKDDLCEIMTVGRWYGMTGYAFGFPKGSKWIEKVNKFLMDYQAKGELERMRNFWLTGACTEGIHDGGHNSPLGILNFISAFVLLGAGLVISLLGLGFEFVYMQKLRPKLLKLDQFGWCGLFSMSLAKSLSFGDVVDKLKEDIVSEKRQSGDMANMTTRRARSEKRGLYSSIPLDG